MDKEIIALISVVIGASLVWLLNQVTLWHRDKKDDNRSRKEVLYYLLEFRNMLVGLNSDPIMNILKESLSKRVTANEIEVEQITKQLFIPVYSAIANRIIGNKIPFLKEGFGQAVAKLSSVDPVLAYRLAGQDEILVYGNTVLEALQAQSQSENELSPEVLQQMMSILNSHIYEDSTCTFDDLIENVSRKIGNKAWDEAEEELRNIKNKLSSANPDIDEVINKLLDQFENNTH